MELYDQKINEFVDWVSGNNKLTGRNVTENMKPSGKVIRELLQDRLQSPIFIPSKDNYEGYVEDGYWRIFSSKEAYSEWLKDKNGLARLELARFPKQSEYEFEINGLDNNLRYIIEGNASQSNAILSYSWAIKKGNNNVNDSIRVTYTITNRATKKTTTFTHLFQNSQRDIELNIYEYIHPSDIPVYKLRPEMYKFGFDNPVCEKIGPYNNDFDMREGMICQIHAYPFNITNIKYNLINKNSPEVIW